MGRLLYLIRHGETTGLDMFQGFLDLPLSERGHEQARVAMRSVVVRQAYVSPRQRCLQTASYLDPGTPTSVLADLTEIDFGAWEGMAWKDVEDQWPELAASKSKDWLGVAPPNGESWSDFQTRVGRALSHMLQESFPAAVIAHQMTNAALVHIVTGRRVDAFRQSFCDVLCLDLDAQRLES